MKVKNSFFKIPLNLLISLSFILVLFSIYQIKNNQKQQDPFGFGNYDESKKLAVFNGKEIKIPKEIPFRSNSFVLGEKSDKEEKRIEINLTKQELYAYEGKDRVFDFKVSTGKWKATPTGEFRIWSKFRYVLMSGGDSSIGTYYYLPNVPFTMFFYNGLVSQGKGYSIHGTYWHDNFGHPMSHGCINMKTEEAEKIYYWANPAPKEGANVVYASEDDPGTRVIIYGEAPDS